MWPGRKERRLIGERTKAELAARKVQAAKLANPRNASATPAIGRQAHKADPDLFAANVLPIGGAIRAGGVTGLRGFASTRNSCSLRAARAGKWHVSNVSNVRGPIRADQCRVRSRREVGRRTSPPGSPPME